MMKLKEKCLAKKPWVIPQSISMSSPVTWSWSTDIFDQQLSLLEKLPPSSFNLFLWGWNFTLFLGRILWNRKSYPLGWNPCRFHSSEDDYPAIPYFAAGCFDLLLFWRNPGQPKQRRVNWRVPYRGQNWKSTADRCSRDLGRNGIRVQKHQSSQD